jgi:hypothetical protein
LPSRGPVSCPFVSEPSWYLLEGPRATGSHRVARCRAREGEERWHVCDKYLAPPRGRQHSPAARG